MMKNNKGASKAARVERAALGTQPTTTEELIVQYLDGELVRKELEAVLFDRLAQSEDARTLLREYLVVRGAIRQSTSDQQFQFSADLDGRTRQRIEQMFERISAEGFDVVFPASGAEHATEFLPDRPRIATNPFERRVKQWSLRASLAALALLLAIGTTWYVTHSTDEHATKQLAANAQSSVVTPNIVAIPPPTTIVPTPAIAKVPAERRHIERTSRAISEPSMAANNVSRATMVTQAAAPAAQDIMITDRFGKAIQAAKHEVVISSRDRL